MDFGDANKLPQQVFGVKLNFNFGIFTTKHKVDQSKWQLDQQKQLLENTRLVKQKEDDLLQLQLTQASDDLNDIKQILDLQKENDLHTENKYNQGIISLNNRLDHYDDLLAIQDQYLQSLANYTLSQYKIYIRQINTSEKN
jgi:outer membrane protein TolC